MRAWAQIGRRRPPTEAQQRVIDKFLAVMDKTGPERLARLFLENETDPIGAVLRDLDAFKEERKQAAIEAEKKAAEAPRGRSRLTRIGDAA